MFLKSGCACFGVANMEQFSHAASHIARCDKIQPLNSQ